MADNNAVSVAYHGSTTFGSNDGPGTLHHLYYNWWVHYFFDIYPNGWPNCDNGANATHFQAWIRNTSLPTTYDLTDPTLSPTNTARGEAWFQNSAVAFDYDLSEWEDPTSTTNSWIEVQFANSATYAVTRYTITNGGWDPKRDPAVFRLLGSNDGVNYTQLDARSGVVFSARNQKLTFTFTNSTPYNRYKLAIDETADIVNGDKLVIADIELYTR